MMLFFSQNAFVTCQQKIKNSFFVWKEKWCIFFDCPNAIEYSCIVNQITMDSLMKKF